MQVTIYLHTNIYHVYMCTYHKLTAMQMWTLTRYLPLLIGDLIPEDDACWETFLGLLDIMDICLAPTTNDQQASYLGLLIKSHHQSFLANYPNVKLIPKQHYMVHYPTWMIRYLRTRTFKFYTVPSYHMHYVYC